MNWDETLKLDVPVKVDHDSIEKCKEFVKNASVLFKSLPFDSTYEYSVVLLINFFSRSVSITTWINESATSEFLLNCSNQNKNLRLYWSFRFPEKWDNLGGS